jgi:hypothetical protein
VKKVVLASLSSSERASWMHSLAKAQPARGMDFVNFVQFCEDFKLVPRLATMHELLRAYNCAECLDYPEARDLPNARDCASPQIPLSPTEYALKDFTQHILNSYRDLNAAFIGFDTSKNALISLTEFKDAAIKIGYQGDFKVVFRELEKNGRVSRDQFFMLKKHIAPEIATKAGGKLSSAIKAKSNALARAVGAVRQKGFAGVVSKASASSHHTGNDNDLDVMRHKSTSPRPTLHNASAEKASELVPRAGTSDARRMSDMPAQMDADVIKVKSGSDTRRQTMTSPTLGQASRISRIA